MSLKDLIKNMRLKKNISKIKEKSAVEKTVDDMLADEMKRMAATSRTVDKIAKMKLMRIESTRALQEVREMDNEEDIDYEDEPDAPTWEDKIKEQLLGKILGNVAPAAPVAPQETMGAEGAVENVGGSKEILKAAVSNLTESQAKNLKEKLLG